jgi:excisionase family DNA binding protein
MSINSKLIEQEKTIMETMLNYNEVSKLTGIIKPTLYAMVSEKRIPHYRFGGRLVRFSKIEIENWIKICKVKA